MAHKLEEEDLAALRIAAKGLPIYTLRDEKGNIMQEKLPKKIKGRDLERYGVVLGPTTKYRPNIRYVIWADVKSNPFTFLKQRAEEFGPEGMSDAIRDYMAEYKRVQEIIQRESFNKQQKGNESEQPPSIDGFPAKSEI